MDEIWMSLARGRYQLFTRGTSHFREFVHSPLLRRWCPLTGPEQSKLSNVRLIQPGEVGDYLLSEIGVSQGYYSENVSMS